MQLIDPASKNELFKGNSVYEYMTEYKKALDAALSLISATALENAFNLLEASRESHAQIWVVGNGGSSAIADHLCCDFNKGTRLGGHKGLRAHSLTANTALLTALANDFKYENVFSEQLDMFAAKGDLALFISSSGNSENVIKGAQWAAENGVKTIGFTGFSGGRLAKMTDVNLHVAANNYGIVEDAHQILMHCFAQYLVK